MRKDFTAENAATVISTFCEIDLLDPNKKIHKKMRPDSVPTHRPAKVLSLGGRSEPRICTSMLFLL